MNSEESNKFVVEFVECLEGQQSENQFKYAYITGYLQALLKYALSGEQKTAIRCMQSEITKQKLTKPQNDNREHK